MERIEWLLNEDERDKSGFRYQLTQWLDSIDDLYRLCDCLDKYKTDYAIRIWNGKSAAFTRGENITDPGLLFTMKGALLGDEIMIIKHE